MVAGARRGGERGSGAGEQPLRDGTGLSDAEILARVELHGPRVILVREFPVITPRPYLLMTQRVIDLAAELGRYALVVDMSATRHPGAEMRELIKQRVPLMMARSPVFFSMVMGRNVVARTVARFLVAVLALPKFEIEESVADALRKAEHALARAEPEAR